MNIKLSPNAEGIRKVIKSMIPDNDAIEDDTKGQQTEKAIVRTRDAKGNLIYDGELFGAKLSQLMQEMNIGEVGKPSSLALPLISRMASLP